MPSVKVITSKVVYKQHKTNTKKQQNKIRKLLGTDIEDKTVEKKVYTNEWNFLWKER